MRRQEVHRMLDAGQVQTANDYFHAALIFQHGRQPDEYLLAHVLAVYAISLGDKDARWLAAATLDRFLLSISRPQIYGTQFESVPGKTNSWAQRTMNSLLLSDTLRAAACVVPLKLQRAILDEFNLSGRLDGGTDIRDCP